MYFKKCFYSAFGSAKVLFEPQKGQKGVILGTVFCSICPFLLQKEAHFGCNRRKSREPSICPSSPLKLPIILSFSQGNWLILPDEVVNVRLIVQTQAASLRTQAASVETQVASEEFGRMRGTLGLDGRRLGRVRKWEAPV